jgi:hypothetical protein
MKMEKEKEGYERKNVVNEEKISTVESIDWPEEYQPLQAPVIRS